MQDNAVGSVYVVFWSLGIQIYLILVIVELALVKKCATPGTWSVFFICLGSCWCTCWTQSISGIR